MERWHQFSQLNLHVKNQRFRNPQPMPSFGGGGALPKFSACPAQLRRNMVVGARQGNKRDGQDRHCVGWYGCCKETNSCLARSCWICH